MQLHRRVRKNLRWPWTREVRGWITPSNSLPAHMFPAAATPSRSHMPGGIEGFSASIGEKP